MLKQKSSAYRGYRTAGIRLREEMLPQLSKIYGGHMEAFLPAVHAFDKAHAVMLVEEGLLALPAGIATLRGLRQMEAEGVVESRMRAGGGLHSGEQYLIRLLGEDIGGRFHLARSSGDLSTIGINILQREKLLALMRAVNRLRRVLIELARQHTDTILPGYSFGQHAQPMTLAHFWLSWAATLARDFDRLHGAYRRVNVSPAGAAIMVGSNFTVNRERTAELLGFDARPRELRGRDSRAERRRQPRCAGGDRDPLPLAWRNGPTTSSSGAPANTTSSIFPIATATRRRS